ncbi:MAG: hypothetical protein HKN39_02475 [Flavobacteriales bacterium]|nr:hypothetical protein [Flavobacteriales bacterium]
MLKNNKTIESHRLTNESLSSNIEKKDSEFRTKHTGDMVKKICAMEMNTITKGSSILDFTGELQRDYQSLIELNNDSLQGESVLNHHRLRTNAHQEEIESIENKIGKENAELTRKRSELDEQAKNFRFPLITWNWVLFVLAILSFSETIINYKMLSLLGGNIISSIATAILVSLSVFFYCHLAGSKIRKYSNNILWKKVLLFAVFLAPMVFLMYQLAMIRMKYMELMNLGSLMITSPMAFTFINSLVLTISLWLVYTYKPDSSYSKRYKQFLKDSKEIDHLNNSIDQQDKNKRNKEHVFGTECGDRFDMLLLGHRNEQDIINRYRSCFEAMKIAMLIRNSQTQKLFDNKGENDLPPLKCYYENYKNHMNQ